MTSSHSHPYHLWTLSETPLQTNLVIASLVSTASYNRISWMLKLAAKEIHIQFSLNERFPTKKRRRWWWWCWWGAWWPSSSPSLARGGVWEWDGGHKKRLAVRATYPTTYHESLWSDRPLKKNAKRNKLIWERQASSSHNQSSFGSLWKRQIGRWRHCLISASSLRRPGHPHDFIDMVDFAATFLEGESYFVIFWSIKVYCLHAKDTKKVLSLQIWVTVYKMQIEEKVPFSKNTNQAKYSKKMQQNRKERCSPGTLPFESFSPYHYKSYYWAEDGPEKTKYIFTRNTNLK